MKFPMRNGSAYVHDLQQPVKFCLTRRTVVADGEQSGERGIDQGVRALEGSTANLGGGSPDDLSEVTPSSEVAHVNVVLAIGTWVEGHFSVVHVVANHRRDSGRSIARTDVLAVAAAAGRAETLMLAAILVSQCVLGYLRVVGKDTGLSNGQSNISQASRPGQVGN